jgi:hypothetical protein
MLLSFYNNKLGLANFGATEGGLKRGTNRKFFAFGNGTAFLRPSQIPYFCAIQKLQCIHE